MRNVNTDGALNNNNANNANGLVADCAGITREGGAIWSKGYGESLSTETMPLPTQGAAFPFLRLGDK